MKIKKRAEQKNVILQRDFYTVNELNLMLAEKEIYYYKNLLDESYEPVSQYDLRFNEIEFRIFTEDLEKLEVAYDEEYGYYETVAIGKNGKTYHVTL